MDKVLLLGPISVSVVIGIFSIFLLYWYSVRNHDYWKKRGIPSAKTYPFFGSVIESFIEPHHFVVERRYKELGRIYGHFEASKPALSVAEPTLLRNIFVKDFAFFNRRHFDTRSKIINSMLSMVQGEDWKRIRSIVSPTFSTGKIKRMMNIFKECSRTLVQNFKSETQSSKTINAKRLFGAFTMDDIANSAFSTKIDSHNDPDNKFVRMARRVFTSDFNWRFLFYVTAPGLMKTLGIPVFDSGSIDFFTDVTFQIMEERKKTGRSRNDFLQLLMDTANEVSEEEKLEDQDKEKKDITSNYGEEDIGHQIRKIATSKRLSMEELVSQCISFFLAGFDSTASTLAFATYSLALNPEIQDKLRKEVDDVMKSSNGELSYEAIQNMKYLDNVISETLRLYPPTVRLERITTADYKLGDTGIIIPKGMLVTIPAYAIHRDPEFYPNPEKFDPNRFTTEVRSIRDLYTYLPFGTGPRNCVAMRFALMEIKTCLAHIIANFNIKRCPETTVPLQFYYGRGFIQSKDIILKLEIREDCQLVK